MYVRVTVSKVVRLAWAGLFCFVFAGHLPLFLVSHCASLVAMPRAGVVVCMIRVLSYSDTTRHIRHFQAIVPLLLFSIPLHFFWAQFAWGFTRLIRLFVSGAPIYVV